MCQTKTLGIHRWCMRASFSFSWQIETYRATIKMLVGWDLCCLLMAWVMAFAVAQRIRCECVSFIHYLTLNSLLDHCLWETTQIIYVSIGWERMKLNLCYFIRSFVSRWRWRCRRRRHHFHWCILSLSSFQTCGKLFCMLKLRARPCTGELLCRHKNVNDALKPFDPQFIETNA